MRGLVLVLALVRARRGLERYNDRMKSASTNELSGFEAEERCAGKATEPQNRYSWLFIFCCGEPKVPNQYVLLPC